MYIQENLDYDLRIVIDLDYNPDNNADGVDRLPYTFTVLEDENFWADCWYDGMPPKWRVIFSEKFDEYSPFLDLPEVMANPDSFNGEVLVLRSKYTNGSDLKITQGTYENAYTYNINILEGASRRYATSIDLHEDGIEKLVAVVKEVRRFLDLDRKHREEKEKLRYKLNDEFYITFRPDDTSIHSFNNDPPASWDNVYKVYYSYKIEEVWSFEEEYSSEIVLDTGCDECSCMPYLADVLEHFDDNAKNNVLKVRPFGDGVDWEIEKFYFKYEKMNYYTFKLFNGSPGCRFTLSEVELQDFILWLKYINDYALKVCGCGI